MPTGLPADQAVSEQQPWPGVLEPRCDWCTWAPLGGVLQVKFVHRTCPDHGHLLGRRRLASARSGNRATAT